MLVRESAANLCDDDRLTLLYLRQTANEGEWLLYLRLLHMFGLSHGRCINLISHIRNDGATRQEHTHKRASAG